MSRSPRRCPATILSEIVGGYLRATSNFQPDYATAKQFLTRSASAIWSPEVGVSIFRGAPVQERQYRHARGKTGRLARIPTAPTPRSRRRSRSASAWSRRTASGGSTSLRRGCGWRSSRSCPSIAPTSCTSSAILRRRRRRAGAQLDLPAVSGDPANIASALMKALLNGPSKWLTPAVTTAIPRDTTLSVDPVTITDGIAEVPLSDTLLAPVGPPAVAAGRSDPLHAQADRQSSRRVDHCQRTALPGSRKRSEQSGRRCGRDPAALEPVPSVTNDVLYAARDNQVGLVNDAAEPPKLTPFDGPPRRWPVRGRPARRVGHRHRHRCRHRRSHCAAARGHRHDHGAVRRCWIQEAVSRPAPPEFTRFGELWAVGEGPPAADVAGHARRAVEIDAPCSTRARSTPSASRPTGPGWR